MPTWRARDVTREIDVIEEIARFRLEDVPFTLPRAPRDVRPPHARAAAAPPASRTRSSASGFAETYTPSLRPDDETTWKLPEPISVELTALRTTLLPSLVEAARRNVDAGARRIALFEIARVYLPDGGDLPERAPARRRASPRAASCARRASSRRCTRALKAEPTFERASIRCCTPARPPGRRPASSASCTRGCSRASGARSSSTSRSSSRTSHEPVTYEDVITYPAVRQDIAVAVAEDVAVGDLVAAAREAAGPELREIRVFDVYRGEQVGAGRKSVAFSVAFQSAERTLSERGRDAAARRDRRRARRAASAPSFEHEKSGPRPLSSRFHRARSARNAARRIPSPAPTSAASHGCIPPAERRDGAPSSAFRRRPRS